MTEEKPEVLPFELALLNELSGIRRCLETIVLHVSVMSGEFTDALTRRVPKAKRRKRKRRKPRGIAASLVALVLAGCGGVVELPSSARDAGAELVEAAPRDAACVEHDGILCMHPKVRREAD